MNPEDAVVDEIDRLVEESLTKPWHQVSGYDNNIGQPRCRCGANWHGLPTAFCPGSDTEGPTRLIGHGKTVEEAALRFASSLQADAVYALDSFTRFAASLPDTYNTEWRTEIGEMP